MKFKKTSLFKLKNLSKFKSPLSMHQGEPHKEEPSVDKIAGGDTGFRNSLMTEEEYNKAQRIKLEQEAVMNPAVPLETINRNFDSGSVDYGMSSLRENFGKQYSNFVGKNYKEKTLDAGYGVEVRPETFGDRYSFGIQTGVARNNLLPPGEDNNIRQPGKVNSKNRGFMTNHELDFERQFLNENSSVKRTMSSKDKARIEGGDIQPQLEDPLLGEMNLMKWLAAATDKNFTRILGLRGNTVQDYQDKPSIPDQEVPIFNEEGVEIGTESRPAAYDNTLSQRQVDAMLEKYKKAFGDKKAYPRGFNPNDSADKKKEITRSLSETNLSQKANDDENDNAGLDRKDYLFDEASQDVFVYYKDGDETQARIEIDPSMTEGVDYQVRKLTNKDLDDPRNRRFSNGANFPLEDMKSEYRPNTKSGNRDYGNDPRNDGYYNEEEAEKIKYPNGR